MKAGGDGVCRDESTECIRAPVTHENPGRVPVEHEKSPGYSDKGRNGQQGYVPGKCSEICIKVRLPDDKPKHYGADDAEPRGETVQAVSEIECIHEPGHEEHIDQDQPPAGYPYSEETRDGDAMPIDIAA